MVFYFTSNVVSPPYTLYMGFDKFENEELIKYAFPEDVWFHVDKVSSAHVYIRLRKGESLDDVPQSVMTDCAQLVKANSIEGNKMNNINIVYTMASNLKKTGSMDVGQVGFHKNKEVKSLHVEKRVNEIVNRLNKTKEEQHPDLRSLREDRDRQDREQLHRRLEEQRRSEREQAQQRLADAQLRSYDNIMKEENMSSNKDDGNESDEFM